jgi:hypothetical protein
MKKPAKKISYHQKMKEEITILKNENQNLLHMCRDRDKKVAELQDEVSKNEAFRELANAPLFSLADMVRFAQSEE